MCSTVKTNSSDEENETVEEQSKLKANPAWADAIAKVLKQNKPNGKRFIVLSRAKKIADIKEKEKLGFEIVGGEEKKDSIEDEDDKKEVKPSLKLLAKAKEFQNKGRLKSTDYTREMERELRTAATRGVVQLFNKVRQQQKELDNTLKNAGKSKIKRERALNVIDKKKYLDVLNSAGAINEKVKEEEREEPEYDVFKNTFNMTNDLKGWDQESDNDVEMSNDDLDF